MSKKKFSTPFILFEDDTVPGDDVVIGGGTGQGTPDDPYACSYDEWKTVFAEDYDLDDDVDFDDYRTWWEDNEFSLTDWETYNPGVPFIVEP